MGTKKILKSKPPPRGSPSDDVKLTTRSVAHMLGLSPKTLENWRSQGTGPPYIKLGGRVLYSKADLESWLASCRIASA